MVYHSAKDEIPFFFFINPPSMWLILQMAVFYMMQTATPDIYTQYALE